MLIELTIRDFAIIDHLQLHLSQNFNVFTGETGAGKSIIIDAVNALLGGKIGAEFVRAGCRQASVEGVFSLEPLPSNSGETLSENKEAYLPQSSNDDDGQPNDEQNADARVALATLLQEYDLYPEDDQLILTRDIFPSGRTVARINGRTVTQHTLQQVASWLVDIHGQNENMSLLRSEQHINLLDRFADTLPLRNQLGERVTAWRNARKQLQELQHNVHEQERRAEFLHFEIEEIEKAELHPGEIEELEAERNVLNNAERLRELSAQIHGFIQGNDETGEGLTSSLDQLLQAQQCLSELVRLDESMAEHEETLASAIYQLEDIATAISSYAADIEDDPNRLAEVEERLDLLARLRRKYGATIEEILQHAEQDQTELETIENRDELIGKLQQEDGRYRNEIGALAEQLSRQRYAAAEILSKAMEEQLNDLNMRRARFKVEITQQQESDGVPASLKDGEQAKEKAYYHCDATGIDQVQFLIAPNPGEPFKPLTKIASGGETSRLMLAFKTILADADATPTLIFDEIDAGISGSSGRIVGEKLWQLTQNHQVICVTHLSQIAAFADTHYNVNKQIFDDRTVTIVNELQPEQRVREIAHITGGNVSVIALKGAEEMLDRSTLWKENWLRQHKQEEKAHQIIER